MSQGSSVAPPLSHEEPGMPPPREPLPGERAGGEEPGEPGAAQEPLPPEAVPAPVLAPPGAPGPEAATDEAAVPAAAPTAELVLRFSGLSWVEITDAAGERLAVRMGRAGDVLELAGIPPFEVLLGNAPNVHLEYNGKPYTDIPASRQNVASFTLGAP